MPYRISICIPTYNRMVLLDNLLGQLCPAVVACSQPAVVQVCVSDNCSPDQTAEILSSYEQKYSFLAVRRSQENMGFGRNLWAVAHMAQSEYIYFTGDDDALSPGALEVLLKSSLMNEADLILLNSHPTVVSNEQGFAPGSVERIAGMLDYLNKLGIFHASFIGNLLFKKSSFVKYGNVGDAAWLSAYPHMFPVFRAIRDGNSFFVNSPVTIPDDSARGSHKIQPVLTSIDMARIAREEVVPYLSKAAGRTLLLQLARSLPRAIVRRLKKQITLDKNNPYQSLSVSNLRSIYGW